MEYRWDLSKVAAKSYDKGIGGVVPESFLYNWYISLLSETLRNILNDHFMFGGWLNEFWDTH